MRELGSTSLLELAQSADIIAVAKIAKVVEIDGNRVGDAVVLSPILGATVGQHFTIAGYKTWVCDATQISQGECGLFFLNRNDNRPKEWAALQYPPEPRQSPLVPWRQSVPSWQQERYLRFERRRKQLFGDIPLLFIAASGQGVLPIDPLGTIFLMPVVKEFVRNNRSRNQVRYQCGWLTLPRELPFFPLTASVVTRDGTTPPLERTGGVIPIEELAKKILALRAPTK